MRQIKINNGYFERQDHEIILPLFTKNEIEVIFYPIGRDTTGFELRVYDKFDECLENTFYEVKGQQKYAVGNTIFSYILKEIKHSLKEYMHGMFIDRAAVATPNPFKHSLLNASSQDIDKLNKDGNKFNVGLDGDLKIIENAISESIRKIDGLYDSKVKDFYCNETGRTLGNARILIRGEKIDNGSYYVITVIGKDSAKEAKILLSQLDDIFTVDCIGIDYGSFQQILIDKKVKFPKLLAKVLENITHELPTITIDKMYNIIIDLNLPKNHYSFVNKTVCFSGEVLNA